MVRKASRATWIHICMLAFVSLIPMTFVGRSGSSRSRSISRLAGEGKKELVFLDEKDQPHSELLVLANLGRRCFPEPG
eukprot:g21312.t1